jgi:hypothetical protein
MKKVLLSLLALVVVAVSLTACTPAKVYKFGVGVVMSVSGSAATAEVDGKYGVNVDIVTVVVDKDGKIVEATWDVAQTSNLKFDVLGTLKTDLSTYVLKTKGEKGAAYGMKGSSGISKEWNEQAAFLSDYVVGMTKADIEAIELENGDATDSEILAGATITLTAWKAALIEAINNVVEVKKAATFGWAAAIAVSGSAATAEVDGKYGVNVDLASVVLDKDGKVLHATWDVAQASNLKFDVLGALKADPASYTKTKLEKGADYGMKGSSGISKEWNEQAAFLNGYIVGKTAADIEAIELENGDATDSEILAGATITLSSWKAVTLKAIDAAVDFTK